MRKEVKKIVLTLVITSILISTALYMLPVGRAAAPTVEYLSPADSATFVDVMRGDGVNYTVNVSDSDGNLQQVVLQDNASGSWVTFYDSGSLGGVSYHNHSGVNSHWTGSWETYYWKVCAYDGSWTNVTYSFTTEYVFGIPHPIVVDDTKDIKTSIVYKNTTSEYYLWADIGHIGVNQSTNGVDFAIHSTADTGLSGDYPYNAFTYNNIPYLYYYYNDYLRYLWYNQTAGAWQSGSTGIVQYDTTPTYHYAYGADIKYYNGQYQLVAGYQSGYNSRVGHYTSNNPLGGFSHMSDLDSKYLSSDSKRYLMPSLNILNGKLILTYSDTDYDLHWQVYDGSSWTDKGDIEADISSSGKWSSTFKDPVNNQLVCVYINASDWLVYRTLTDPDGMWSDLVVIYKPNSETIGYLHADYIDRRIVITLGSNIRGNYNLYMITAPDYTEVTSGINTTLNRIQFPDAIPNQQHVNSTVFAIKNINDRAVENITWHVGDIGDIQTASNVKVWSNMSGSWQSWSVGSDQNTSEIDISAVKGSEWQPGETLYWKLEILDVGSVPEDLHANDEDIWYIVDLEV